MDIQLSNDRVNEIEEMLKNFSGIEKASMLMIGLGKSATSELFKMFSNEEIEALTEQIALRPIVRPELNDAVFEEYYQMIKAQEYVSLGGLDYAKEVLQEALGDTRAIEIIKKIQRLMQVTGFNVLKQVDSTQLLTFIQQEHPQTIALVLTQLEPQQAATILGELSEELRNDVIMRFATMERVSSEMIQAVEKVLEERIDFSQQGSQFGGVKAAAEIINMVGSTIEKSILEAISAKDAKLSNEIKNLMFVFEDIIFLDDRTIQTILRDIDQKDLTMALKGVEDDVKNKIFNNMSERGAAIIQEEMEFAGPVRLREVEVAQQAILDVIRKLEELGEIQLTKGREDFID